MLSFREFAMPETGFPSITLRCESRSTKQSELQFHALLTGKGSQMALALV